MNEIYVDVKLLVKNLEIFLEHYLFRKSSNFFLKKLNNLFIISVVIMIVKNAVLKTYYKYVRDVTECHGKSSC